MPLFLFFAFFNGRRPAEMASVTAAPLAEFTVRTGVFFQVLFFGFVHIVHYISKYMKTAMGTRMTFPLEISGTLLYFNTKPYLGSNGCSGFSGHTFLFFCSVCWQGRGVPIFTSRFARPVRPSPSSISTIPPTKQLGTCTKVIRHLP